MSSAVSRAGIDTRVDQYPRHLPALDGLRGLAALLVVLGHLPEFGFDAWTAAGTRDWGVVLFFALSGFLMGHLYLRRDCTALAAADFAVARIARIVPIYFIVILLSFIVYQTIDHRFVYNISTQQLVRLLTFNGSVSVFWSVGPEFQFYGVFIGLWWLWHRTATRPWAIGLSILLSSISILLGQHLPGILFLSKAHIFLFGVAAAIILHRLRGNRAAFWLRPTLQILAVASLVLLAVPNPWVSRLDAYLVGPPSPKMSVFYDNPAIAAWAALIVLSLGWGGRTMDRIFGNRLLTLLGEISFSLYLLHEGMLWLLQTFDIQHTLGRPGANILALLACLGAAVMSNRLIEVPSRILVKKHLMAILGSHATPPDESKTKTVECAS